MDYFIWKWTSIVLMVTSVLCMDQQSSTPNLPTENDLFSIEGKLVYVKSVDTKTIDNIQTKISADGNEYLGFLGEDRESFIISGVPPGSYLIEIYHPEFLFETARVDISSKGKIRARRPESLDSSAAGIQNNQIVYPLRLRLLRKATYFQAKEAWRLTDMLMNPMVLMMILPLVVLMVIPKMIQSVDPDTQKEVQAQLNSAYKQPDLSQMMSFLNGPPAKPQAAIKKATDKKEKRRSD